MVALTMNGQVTATSFSPSTTSGIIGTTTNDSAASGSVGEYVTSVIVAGSAVSLTTTAETNITSISLTAGDWNVGGSFGLVRAAGTNITQWYGNTSLTSATVTNLERSYLVDNGAAGIVSGGIFAGVGAIATTRFSLASTTTIYLVGAATFSVSTCSGYGTIWARRMR